MKCPAEGTHYFAFYASPSSIEHETAYVPVSTKCSSTVHRSTYRSTPVTEGFRFGLTRSTHSPYVCLYGFSQQDTVSHWTFYEVIPPSVNTGVASRFLLARNYSEINVPTSNLEKTVCVVGIVKVVQFRAYIKSILSSILSKVAALFSLFTSDVTMLNVLKL